MAIKTYVGVNPRVREVREIAPLNIPSRTQSLPGVDGMLSGARPARHLKNEPLDHGSPLSPTSTTAQTSLSALSPTYGLSDAQNNCINCGTLFSAALLQSRCDQCLAAPKESLGALSTRLSQQISRSPSLEENMAPLHHTISGKVSKHSTVPDLRPSIAGYFWSRRAGTPSDESISPDPGEPQQNSRSKLKRLGKARREKESRDKLAILLKKHEDLILAGPYASRLTDTAELNSNNAQKSGLRYRKEEDLEASFELHLIQQKKVAELEAQKAALEAALAGAVIDGVDGGKAQHATSPLDVDLAELEELRAIVASIDKLLECLSRIPLDFLHTSGLLELVQSLISKRAISRSRALHNRQSKL